MRTRLLREQAKDADLVTLRDDGWFSERGRGPRARDGDTSKGVVNEHRGDLVISDPALLREASDKHVRVNLTPTYCWEVHRHLYTDPHDDCTGKRGEE